MHEFKNGLIAEHSRNLDSLPCEAPGTISVFCGYRNEASPPVPLLPNSVYSIANFDVPKRELLIRNPHSVVAAADTQFPIGAWNEKETNPVKVRSDMKPPEPFSAKILSQWLALLQDT